MVNYALRRGRSGETLVKARGDTDVPIACYTRVFLGPNTNLTISQLVPSAVSLRITETEQLYQAKRMIGEIGRANFGKQN